MLTADVRLHLAGGPPRRDLVAERLRPLPLALETSEADESGLGTLRWVVERTFAWLHLLRRLRPRWERRREPHEAFMHVGCCGVICQRYLNELCNTF